jgi:ribosomal protein S18 acetylase RimI-like enzyme
MKTTIRPCQMSDLETLRTIGYETYDDTFRAMNTAETMDRYLAEAFDRQRLAAELANPHSRFFFLYAEDELAGYLKVNDTPAQSDLHDPESLEIERIYVRKAYKGQGLGRQMMAYALGLAVEMGKRYAWLGVWERNTAAFAFYGKMGFVKAGQHSFRMGDELQTDWIMKKTLVGPAG